MTGKRVLVGCTGSVAAVRIPTIVEELFKRDSTLEIRVVLTEKSQHFFQPESLSVQVCTDEDEWQLWRKIGDPILHIELRRWADLMIIAPLDANTLAKLANGICDNLLTCVVRAWDKTRPLLFAPAMNTHMWQHPVTAKQIETLKDFGYLEIPCIEKKLACGDTGFGGMAEVSTIVSRVLELLNNKVRTNTEVVTKRTVTADK